MYSLYNSLQMHLKEWNAVYSAVQFSIFRYTALILELLSFSLDNMNKNKNKNKIILSYYDTYYVIICYYFFITNEGLLIDNIVLLCSLYSIVQVCIIIMPFCCEETAS